MKKHQATKILTQLLSPYTKIDKNTILNLSLDNWKLIIQIANKYVLVPALFKALKNKNLIKEIENKQLLGYMQEVYNLNTKRNEQILTQIKEVCKILSTIEVTPILLKGVSALSEGHYRSIGERYMLDIDILVPPNRLFDAVDILKKNGYKEKENTKFLDKNHHYPALQKDNNIAPIEIHRYALGDKSSCYFTKNIKSITKKSKTIDNALVIEPTQELFHSFLHTQLSHSYHRKHYLSLQHLHHFTVILSFYKDEISQKALNNSSNQTKELKKIWEEYIFTIDYFFNIENSLEVIKNKSTKKYLKNVKNRIDLANTKRLKIVAFKNELLDALTYRRLKERYPIKNKFLWRAYIPLHIGVLIYKNILFEKSRRNLKKRVKLDSN